MSFELVIGLISISFIVKSNSLTNAGEDDAILTTAQTNVSENSTASQFSGKDINNDTFIPLANDTHHTLSSIDTENHNATSSQDRISYHTKRGAPRYPPLYSTKQRHRGRQRRRPSRSHRNRAAAPPSPKLRKKSRRNRRRPNFSPAPGIPVLAGPPSMPVLDKPMFPKMMFKRNKPVLLSEVLRSGPLHPYAKFKPMKTGLPVKEYFEADELETNPFSTMEMDSLPPRIHKFGRPPPSIEIAEDIEPMEEEILYPGGNFIKASPPIIKRPIGHQIYSMTKPPDIYLDDDPRDTIRNVRFAGGKPPSTFTEEDILKLIQKLKESKDADLKDQSGDSNFALSKLLLPFLSDNATKRIQSYINNLPGDKGDAENAKNVTKVLYIVENQDKEFNKKNFADGSTSASLKTYSIMQPMTEADKNTTTYYIMLKAPGKVKNISSTATTILQSLKNQTRINVNHRKQNDHTTMQPPTSTIPSLQSLALQHYIMSLAGLTQTNREPNTNNVMYAQQTNRQSKSMTKQQRLAE